jgi:hypothetical protein
VVSRRRKRFASLVLDTEISDLSTRPTTTFET